MVYLKNRIQVILFPLKELKYLKIKPMRSRINKPHGFLKKFNNLSVLPIIINGLLRIS